MNPLTILLLLEKMILRLSSDMEGEILERCKLVEGGKKYRKFLKPDFLKQCRSEFPYFLVRPWSLWPL